MSGSSDDSVERSIVSRCIVENSLPSVNPPSIEPINPKNSTLPFLYVSMSEAIRTVINASVEINTQELSPFSSNECTEKKIVTTAVMMVSSRNDLSKVFI
jgi:hypothetical protein